MIPPQIAEIAPTTEIL